MRYNVITCSGASSWTYRTAIPLTATVPNGLEQCHLLEDICLLTIGRWMYDQRNRGLPTFFSSRLESNKAEQNSIDGYHVQV